LLYPRLEFDHICITEADFDFGLVELSTDFGTSWITLASYHMGLHPEWADGDAGPADWVHETIDVEPFLGEKVRLRFRLSSDGFVVDDGWYIDDVRLSQPGCDDLASVPDLPTARALAAAPNPFANRVAFRLPAEGAAAFRALSIFDAAGRLVRRFEPGPRDASSVWDGRDERGRQVPAGVYLARYSAGGTTSETRLIRIR
jgi:hypothetical protein